MTVYKEIYYLHIVNLSLLKELSTLNPIFEDEFYIFKAGILFHKIFSHI